MLSGFEIFKFFVSDHLKRVQDKLKFLKISIFKNDFN